MKDGLAISRLTRTRRLAAGVTLVGLLAGSLAEPVSAQTATSFVQVQPGPKWTSASIGSAGSYAAINPLGSVVDFNGRCSGSTGLVQVAYGSDLSVWAVGANGVPRYCMPGSGWGPLPGVLKQITAGNGSYVYGVNSAGQVWRWSGNFTGWTAMPGTFAFVSVGPD